MINSAGLRKPGLRPGTKKKAAANAISSLSKVDPPPFTLTARAVSLVADIAAQAERFAIRMEQRDALRLRKIHQIKSIRSSLAIEGNTLTEDQVEDILEGRRVVAPLHEIQEVKNAIATYKLYPRLNPFSTQDLLKAHGVMMSALIDDPGCFRGGGMGVTDGKNILHVAPPAKRVPLLMQNLFDWLANAEDHLLIRSCVFHYEFEFIHPFSDGNGRMGRLWQSLILGKFHPAFRHLPVETMVHDNQQAYYDAISQSSRDGDSGAFIVFMLGEILRTLQRHAAAKKRRSSVANGGVNGGVNGGINGGINVEKFNEKRENDTANGVVNGGINGGINGGVNGVVNDVLAHIHKFPGISGNEISEKLSISLRSVERHLGILKKKGTIEYRGAKKTGGYYCV